MNTNANLPSPSAPLTIGDGQLSPVWLGFFLALFTRTGGTVGISADDLLTSITLLQESAKKYGVQISELQADAAQGVPIPDMSALVSMIQAVEALAVQAVSQQQDERGEAGDGAQLAHLSARIAELEARLEALGAPAAVPAGFDTTTINGTPRLIAYY